MASLLSALLVVIVRAQVAPEGGYGGLRQAPLEALLTGFFGPLVLGVLRRIDGRIDMTPARAWGWPRGRARAPWATGSGCDEPARMEIAGQDAELPEIRRRARFFGLFVVLVFLAIAGRLFYLQVIEGDTFYRLTSDNIIRTEALPAVRGQIRDRKNRVLATVRPSYNVYVIAAAADQRGLRPAARRAGHERASRRSTCGSASAASAAERRRRRPRATSARCCWPRTSRARRWRRSRPGSTSPA